MKGKKVKLYNRRNERDSKRDGVSQWFLIQASATEESPAKPKGG